MCSLLGDLDAVLQRAFDTGVDKVSPCNKI